MMTHLGPERLLVAGKQKGSCYARTKENDAQRHLARERYYQHVHVISPIYLDSTNMVRVTVLVGLLV